MESETVDLLGTAKRGPLILLAIKYILYEVICCCDCNAYYQIMSYLELSAEHRFSAFSFKCEIIELEVFEFNGPNIELEVFEFNRRNIKGRKLGLYSIYTNSGN